MKDLTKPRPSKVREVTYVTDKGNFSSYVRKIMNLNLYVLIFRDNSTICLNRRFCFFRRSLLYLYYWLINTYMINTTTFGQK
ncbi:hypothetical protein [Clostridium acidisoli]|uniref:hypothetical protein n=1 Tax=Clostridium acidisoli TaxID=91624 RepID=UPI00111C90F3|nr:hypothetical protein [Clostridium acidisoli]